jgi:phosphopantothenoylcysteine decarboxylase/phosphopantothenate--cysteine ligase
MIFVGRYNVFAGKRILLGISGSIAAYKAVDLLRKLREQGAEVRVSMTKHATHFVSRLTFESLSGQTVLIDDFAVGEQANIGHIDITDDLDAALIAPATANIIGKIASGIADDALTSAIAALACPLLIAPAMNDRMYRNKIVQRNIVKLKEMGVRFIEPETGNLACGTYGQGRLAYSERIIREVSRLFLPQDLAGQTVLVTAGPTREPIDVARFISNASTGKMGYAVAAAAKERGADVILVSGPTQIVPPDGVKIIPVMTAEEMHDAVMEQFPRCNVVIMAAAVSDFKSSQVSNNKIKKDEAPDLLKLVRTQDILKELGKSAGNCVLVGFAAETSDLERNALQKMKDKNLDMVVVNDLLRSGSGFAADTNAVTIIERSGRRQEIPTMLKSQVARIILSSVVEILKEKKSPHLSA